MCHSDSHVSVEGTTDKVKTKRSKGLKVARLATAIVYFRFYQRGRPTALFCRWWIEFPLQRLEAVERKRLEGWKRWRMHFQLALLRSIAIHCIYIAIYCKMLHILQYGLYGILQYILHILQYMQSIQAPWIHETGSKIIDICIMDTYIIHTCIGVKDWGS